MPKIKLHSIGWYQDLEYLDLLHTELDIIEHDTLSDALRTETGHLIIQILSILKFNQSELEGLLSFLGSDNDRNIYAIQVGEGENILEFIRDNGLPAEIYIMLMQYAEKGRLRFITSGELPGEYKNANLDSFSGITVDRYNTLMSIQTVNYVNDAKPYQFLYLNKNMTKHRISLLALLKESGMLDKSLWSALGVYDTLSDDDKQFLPNRYADFFNEGANPSEFLNKGSQHDHRWPDGRILPELYNDTYFSVITETRFYGHTTFFTEKIYKILLAGHPFILVSTPGIYVALHKRGYKTFSDYIDESFDLETNHDIRLQKIAIEIAKLASKDLAKFARDTASICQHNRVHFLEENSTLIDRQRSALLNLFEINTNAKTN
jgi:hypothetical protein